ncbi:MAG: flavodoxin [Acutalibacteraceae bacterium]
MKKSLYAIICVMLIIALAACSNSTPPANKNTEITTNPPTSEIIAETENQSEESSGKVLVVYYSATGNTRQVAEYIASATGGDLFELVPKTPYSDDDLDWTDENSRVSVEYANPDKRNVALTTATVENWRDYDTVFIGYPIWWGIAAWPIDGFISANDFGGKTVVPFCTSASSGLGNSGTLLKDAAGSGNWLDGERFSSGVSEAEVKEWINSLNLADLS